MGEQTEIHDLQGVLGSDIAKLVDGFFKIEPKLATIGGIEVTPRIISFSGTYIVKSPTREGVESYFITPFECKVDNFDRILTYNENHGNTRFEITLEGGLESLGCVLVKTTKSVDGIMVQHGSYQFHRSGAVTEKLPAEHNLLTLENTFNQEFMEVSKRALFQLANYQGDKGVAMDYVDHGRQTSCPNIENNYGALFFNLALFFGAAYLLLKRPKLKIDKFT